LWLINLLSEYSKLILTGIFIVFVSTIFYRITPTGFVSFGKYRTKEGAIAIYLISIVFLGFFTPLIYWFSILIIKTISIITIIGFILFLSNFIINQSVPNWRHTSLKTLLFYFSSIILIIIGFIINI
jgi:hypothetical protein